jgi:signal transduction histidine kinase
MVSSSPAPGRLDMFGLVRRSAAGIVSPWTWLALIYVSSGVGVAIATFVFVTVGLALGLGLLVIAVGALVIVGTLLGCQAIAAFERTRAELFLGVSIPRPALPPLRLSKGLWSSFKALLAPIRWRFLAGAVVSLPINLLGFGVVSTVWAIPLIALPLPLYAPSLPHGGLTVGGDTLRGPAVVLAVALGVASLMAAPPVTRAVARLEGTLVRLLYGTGLRGLEERIEVLEDTRARVLDAAETERRRIERDLHDGAQQRLVALAMQLGRAKARVRDDPEAAARLIDEAHQEAKTAIAELRALVRGVHPPVLSDRGLDAALSGLAALSPIPVSLEVEIAQRPSPTIEAVAYFVAAESLTNAAKHSFASQILLSARREQNVVRLTVRDDGVGGADPGAPGLVGLADRVRAVDGNLSVFSPPGGGTVITAELPCES